MDWGGREERRRVNKESKRRERREKSREGRERTGVRGSGLLLKLSQNKVSTGNSRNIRDARIS